MGKYFKMSRRFDKRKPSDFGLIADIEENCAIDPEDGSVWHSCALYDFGWGCENGFYRAPLLGFSELLEIVVESNEQEDVYGAAAIILELYPSDLLKVLERIYATPESNAMKTKLATVFQLHLSINRSHTQGKRYSEIVADFNRWCAITEVVNRLK